MNEPVYRRLASIVQALRNCTASGNTEWYAKHAERAELIARDLLPAGSGIDSGTTIDLDRSTPNRLVLNTAYHHMDDGGSYAGWTEHTVIVTPDLQSGYNLRITGRDRNDIKEYLHQTFAQALETECVGAEYL